jgi:hypothetical protein
MDTVINNEDGTVEMVLGIGDNTANPHRYAKIRIEPVDGAPPFQYWPRTELSA